MTTLWILLMIVLVASGGGRNCCWGTPYSTRYLQQDAEFHFFTWAFIGVIGFGIIFFVLACFFLPESKSPLTTPIPYQKSPATSINPHQSIVTSSTQHQIKSSAKKHAQKKSHSSIHHSTSK